MRSGVIDLFPKDENRETEVSQSLVKLKSNANEITRSVHTHVWFLSYHAQKFSRRCLYVFVLYLLPSLAVVKDSLTTELSVNSSSLNMLFT